MTNFRGENDSIGEVEVPSDKRWSKQRRRSRYLAPTVQNARSWITVTSLGIILLAGGCARTGSSDQAVSSSQSKVDVEVPQTPIPPLALAAPAAIANETTQKYLDALSIQGFSPSNQGIWIQTDTKLIADHQGTVPLSAASITKVATSLATLKALGPEHRYRTQIGVTGPIEKGIVKGDLVIQGGADPFFVWEDAIALGNLLQTKGIQRVTGNLIIQGPFYMNFETDPSIAGDLLVQGLNHQLWPSSAAAQYATLPPGTPQPQVQIDGTVQSAPTPPIQMQLVVDHASLPLAELLKKMNNYSNNQMAEILAGTVGGATRVAQMAAQEAGVPAAEIQLVNGSGLALENRISPRAACGMFQAIARLLHPYDLTIADVFTVAGEDDGILDDRPLPPLAVLKSGTLNSVSALAGALPTQTQGVVWFAILNVDGNTVTYRAEQEDLLQTLLAQWGSVSQSPLLLRPGGPRQNQASNIGWRR